MQSLYAYSVVHFVDRLLCCVVLCCVCCIVLYCVVLYCVVLRCVVLRCVALRCITSCPRSVELVSESQVSLISETPFRMHNRVLDMIFPFSNKVLLKFYLGQFKCY